LLGKNDFDESREVCQFCQLLSEAADFLEEGGRPYEEERMVLV
jgi:hypothetical protein